MQIPFRFFGIPPSDLRFDTESRDILSRILTSVVTVPHEINAVNPRPRAQAPTVLHDIAFASYVPKLPAGEGAGGGTSTKRRQVKMYKVIDSECRAIV